MEGGAQEAANLGRRVQIRPGPLRLKGQEVRRGHFGARIGGAAIVRKGPHVAQAPGPIRRLRMRRLLRPGQRQRLGDHGRPLLLQEPDEREESLARILELEAKGPAHAEVLVRGLAERGHRAPPGQGNASVRNAVRSTLA
jgi:hypothetical protein